ncbi:MAG: polyphosphate:AMP phosphotransferase, partial [Oceanobacter sp.]
MFEVAELGHRIDAKEYEEAVPELRTDLLVAQEELKRAGFSVVVLFAGSDGAGKAVMVNRLNEWLDPRYVDTTAFGEPTDGERDRPEYWRFWRTLPAAGRIGMYIGSWYSPAMIRRITGEYKDAEFDGHLLQVNSFEKALVDDGTLVIKVWLHLSKEEQQARLETLEADPATAWRVTEQDKRHLAKYDQFRAISEHCIRETSTGYAPWIIVECTDPHYRDITVARYLLERIQHRLDRLEHNKAIEQENKTGKSGKPGKVDGIPVFPVISRPLTILGSLNMSLKLDKARYEEQLKQYQGRLALLVRRAYEQKISSVIVLEGWDAGGKGGLIRRVIPALDARNFRVIPIAAPTDEERAHHYLWRFWRHIPRAGRTTIYDRSWYGRVLVERVESFASPEEWMRAYAEINDFEQQLTEHGTLVVKFWLHIDQDEQLKRFKEREKIPYKKYKITEEDYRNREKWDEYEHAVNDMVERTSTEFAP